MTPRIVVIGGGISGLAAAHRARELAQADGRKLDVVLLESSGSPGGVVQTTRRDGYLIEEGPDSFLTEKPDARRLAVALGLEADLLGTNGKFARSWVDRAGQLHPTPEAFFLLAPGSLIGLARSNLLSPLGKARAAMDLVLPRKSSRADESIGAFVRRRFGRELYERLAQPMVASVYGADPDSLSLRALMGRFERMEQEHRSLIVALMRRRRVAETRASGPRYSLFETLRGGLAGLPAALARSLPRGSVRTKSRVVRIESPSRTGRRFAISLSSGNTVDAEAVVVALPAHAAAEVVRRFDVQLSSELSGIPYQTAAVVNFGYRIADVPHPMDGFGFVVPRTEGRAILACSFSHVKFVGRAPEGRALLRSFLREGAPGDVVSRPTAEIVGAVRRDLQALLGITTAPEMVSVRRHEHAMPVYRVGHLDRVERIESLAARRPGLTLAGNAYRGVGLPDCIASGEAAAERAFAAL